MCASYGTNNVCISVNEHHEFFQTPKTAFTHTKETASQVIWNFLYFRFNITDDCPYNLKIFISFIILELWYQWRKNIAIKMEGIRRLTDLDNSNDKRPKRDCTKMINSSIEHGVQQWNTTRQLRFVFCPIPLSKHSC